MVVRLCREATRFTQIWPTPSVFFAILGSTGAIHICSALRVRESYGDFLPIRNFEMCGFFEYQMRCIHENLKKENSSLNKQNVDEFCRTLVAPWSREAGKETCSFYEVRFLQPALHGVQMLHLNFSF